MSKKPISQRSPKKPEDLHGHCVYTKELADEIIRAISNSTEGLHKLCKKNPHWPVPSTIRDWIHDVEGFATRYARAQMIRADNMIDEILEIADQDALTYHDEHGNTRVDGGHVTKEKLRIDTRKWLAGKFSPRIYGGNYINDDPENDEEQIQQTRKVIQKCMPVKKRKFPKADE